MDLQPIFLSVALQGLIHPPKHGSMDAIWKPGSHLADDDGPGAAWCYEYGAIDNDFPVTAPIPFSPNMLNVADDGWVSLAL